MYFHANTECETSFLGKKFKKSNPDFCCNYFECDLYNLQANIFLRSKKAVIGIL